MTLDEVREALTRIQVPLFVKTISADKGLWHPAQRDYRLHVTLAKLEPDMYRPGGSRQPESNHPFDLPADEDALRAQVVSAVLMACAHEAIEQVGDGGEHLCDPHRFAGGTDEDWQQWLGLLDGLHDVVIQYAGAMPVR